ncbi:MAG: methyltransferase [bacterium]
MNWTTLLVSNSGTHHVHIDGEPAYNERFDEVLKFHAPGLAPVLRDGQAWHICVDGSPAYERRFSRTFGFYEGLAAVVGPHGWHHIDKDGRDVYETRYDWCGNFQQARCAVRSHDGSYQHIVPDGTPAYAGTWRYAGDYRDGIAVVQARDGHSTHISLDGSLVHNVWFVDLDVFHKGFARARDEDGWMHIDVTGRAVYERRFQAVEPFYNGQARVERFDGGLDVIDERGTTLIELRPALRSEFASLSGDLVGFWRTQTISAAVDLGVIDSLPAKTAVVAERCCLDDDGARRLLRGLGELGIVARQGETWWLTARGEFLQSDHPLTLADAAKEYAGPFSSMWRELPNAMKANDEWKAPDVFGDVARDDQRRAGHHRMLRSYARHDYPSVADALRLVENAHVIDAGGGVGVLAHEIVAAYPTAHVTVLERPEVIAMTESASPRVHLRCGDLFEEWGLRGDAVVLSRVLHDWDDADALRILDRARAALMPGGQLYVVEMLIRADGMAGALCDLHLLMATGGRERSVEHFEKLFSTAGFELSEVRRLPALPSILVGVAQ